MASPDTPALMRHATAVVTTTTPESAVAPKAGATPPVDAASVWGRLVSLAPERPHVNLVKSCVTIGRSADCEERIQGNKFISSHHCTISRVDGDAPVLEDKSTNGVLLNGTRVPKGVPQPLKTGDEITLAVSKEDKARYVAYLIKLSDIPPASAATTPSVGDKRKADSDDKAPEHDSIEENLVCPICQCVMHDAVSIVPCLHSFCAGCLSEWMEKSPKKDCPDCRVRVEKIKRNHMLRNLVEAFLKEHPAKRRPADEIAELDAKNKIKEEEFKPKRRRRDYDDDDDDDDDDHAEGQSHAGSGVVLHVTKPKPKPEQPKPVNLEEKLASLETDRRTRQGLCSPLQKTPDAPIHIEPLPELDRSLLPTPATGECPEHVKAKLRKLAELRESGGNINRKIEKAKMYRNPSIYEKLIDIMKLDETGTNFPKDKYNPSQWGPEDRAERLAERQKEYEKQQFKANANRSEIPFVQGQPDHANRKRKNAWDQTTSAEPSAEQQKREADQQREAMAAVRRRVEQLAAGRKKK
eukprot:m.256554 g.256554  ORF g.256554 m.256554 type:complete len:524 (-) comp19172_c2_seq8:35-1606(-)